MSDEFIRFQALYQHTIYVYLHRFSNHILKHLVNQSLVHCPCIFQPKRYDLVAIQSSFYDKRSLLYIGRMHFDLMIP